MISTLADLLDRFQRLDQREAIRFFDGYRLQVLSYSQLNEWVERFNALLERERLGPGSRLMLWGHNSPFWVAAFWAAVSRRVEVVPVDTASSPQFLQTLLERTTAALLLHDTELDASDLHVRSQPLNCVPALAPIPLDRAAVTEEDIVEIVYTSGTTAEPRGVVHRHRNLAANLSPVGEELDRYRWLMRPFQPIRILNLLPLSHLFGQAMGIYLPLMMGSSVVLVRDLKPSMLVETIRRQRVSVLVGVPRMVQQLADYMRDRFGDPPVTRLSHPLLSIPERWWKCRRQHSALGWKFWAVVVGGATVVPKLETFWGRLGFALIQGYGLTEASPIVALNHPWRGRQGSLGQVVAGQHVRIAHDGEILVKGANVAEEYQDGGRPSDAGGWLHTGDLGEIDSDGRLYFRGRKKDVIVTADGLNIFPQDVEGVLRELPGIADCAVVGVPGRRGEQVHGVILCDAEGIDVARLLGRANRKLETHQRLAGLTIWPEEDFPRTGSTQKIQRHRIRQAIAANAGSTRGDVSNAGPVRRLIAELTSTPKIQIKSEQLLGEELGLSSLDRVELLSGLELSFGIDIDEAEFAALATVGELEGFLRRVSRQPSLQAPSPGPGAAPLPEPRWSRRWPVRVARSGMRSIVILPLFRHYIPLTVEGVDTLIELTPPVLFAANHNSHLDTVALLAALPGQWRSRLAPAVRQEFFLERKASLLAKARLWLAYTAACALFNVYPLPQRTTGLAKALRYTGELADMGACPLIYPEGRRSPNGKLLPFEAGVGLMASRLHLPIVPVYMEGLFEILSQFESWPSSGPVTVRFGVAIYPESEEEPGHLAARLEESFQRLASSGGKGSRFQVPG